MRSQRRVHVRNAFSWSDQNGLRVRVARMKVARTNNANLNSPTTDDGKTNLELLSMQVQKIPNVYVYV